MTYSNNHSNDVQGIANSTPDAPEGSETPDAEQPAGDAQSNTEPHIEGPSDIASHHFTNIDRNVVELRLADIAKEMPNVQNERQVELLVENIIEAVGWERSLRHVRHQYGIARSRVDIALGRFDNDIDKPLVFIECKRPGVDLDNAAQQVFGYAKQRGVPIVVVTDGQYWQIFLTSAVNQSFEHLDIIRDATELSAAKMLAYMSKTLTLSGKAVEYAEVWIVRREDDRQFLDTLYTADQSLLLGQDENIVRKFYDTMVTVSDMAGDRVPQLRPYPAGTRQMMQHEYQRKEDSNDEEYEVRSPSRRDCPAAVSERRYRRVV